MILASDQTRPKRGDIKKTLLDHYRLIGKAADNGAVLIAFPEMSIIGYERENAALFTFSPNDSRLDELLRITANFVTGILNRIHTFDDTTNNYVKRSEERRVGK